MSKTNFESVYLCITVIHHDVLRFFLANLFALSSNDTRFFLSKYSCTPDLSPAEHKLTDSVLQLSIKIRDFKLVSSQHFFYRNKSRPRTAPTVSPWPLSMFICLLGASIVPTFQQTGKQSTLRRWPLTMWHEIYSVPNLAAFNIQAKESKDIKWTSLGLRVQTTQYAHFFHSSWGGGGGGGGSVLIKEL